VAYYRRTEVFKTEQSLMLKKTTGGMNYLAAVPMGSDIRIAILDLNLEIWKSLTTLLDT
jgi:hypothetical protein